jgi:Protein of unknown function (DUF1194)
VKRRGIALSEPTPIRRPLAGSAPALTRRLRAPVLAALVLAAATAQPGWCLDWLVLVVDRSTSIDDRELALQREAYAQLLTDPDVSEALEGVQVAIVEFDTSPEIMVEWTDPQSAARAYRIRRPDRLRGLTAIGSALTTALALLVGKSGRLVIDISGDGPDNVDPARLAKARAAASAQAIEINGLAIATEEAPEIDHYYQASVVNGFVLRIDRREDFLDALKRKLFYEVAGTRPGPALAWRQR